MKVAFILQYYPYQYQQFKLLIDALEADAYYRIHSDYQSEYYNSKVFRVSDGSLVHYSEFPEDYYDCVVYTGTWCRSLIKFADRCRYKNVICMSHSLIGSLYDISIVTPETDRGVGFVPETWMNFSSFHKREDIIKGDRSSTYYVTTKSHPISAQALMTKPQVEIEYDTLGVILGHRSPFSTFSVIIDDLVKKWGIKKVKIKLHPLTEDSVIEKYFNKEYIEVLDKHYDKYLWLDSCEYIIGGCSSLLIEEMLRASYFGTGQLFKQFPFKRRGIPLSIETHDSGKWSLDCEEFKPFAISAQDTINEHIATLELILAGAEVPKMIW